ncbi:MAG: hypothetical protein HOP35_16130 [Nitrospira sp.]|nr:hypothetical protein [Nitrospira sp.]
MLQGILRNNKQVLLALIVTAMPGIQRTLLVLIIQFRFGLQALGQFTNDVSIISMIMHFTAIGWASLILVRVPATEGLDRLFVIRRLLHCIYPVLAIGVVTILVFGFSPWVFQPWPMVCILIGWTGYQLIRHFFVSLRDYVPLLFIDLLSTGCMAALLLFLSRSVSPMFSFGAPLMTVTAVGWAYLIYKSRPFNDGRGLEVINDLKSGIELGMTNFFSDGMILLLGPITNFLVGAGHTGLIGLVMSFLGATLLFPRALAMYHLPELVRANKQTPADFSEAFHFFRRILFKLLMITGVGVLLVGTIGGPLVFTEAASLNEAWAIFLLLLAITLVNQTGLPDSSRLMVKEQSHLMMRINAIAFFTFALFAIILSWLDAGLTSLLLILIGQLAVTTWRVLLLNIYARRLHYGGQVEPVYMPALR